jgi:hypothetical protein
MGLPKDEILSYRFIPCPGAYYLSFNEWPKKSGDFTLAATCIKRDCGTGIVNTRMTYLAPWFNMNYGANGPFYYLLTDLIFVQTGSELSTLSSFKLEFGTILGTIRPCGKLYDACTLWQEAIDCSRAILLSSSKTHNLFAIPWRSNFSKRSQVNRYCRKVFNWFERRATEPAYSKPCPGQVLFSETLDQRIIVDELRTGFNSTYFLSNRIEWDRSLAESKFLNLTAFFSRQCI